MCYPLTLPVPRHVVLFQRQDCAVRLWDVRTGTAAGEHKPHRAQVTCTRFSPLRGMQILTVSKDNRVLVLDARTLEPRIAVADPQLRVTCNWSKADFSPDARHFVVGSSSGGVSVYSADSGELEQALCSHTAPVVSCAWTSGRTGASQVASVDKSGNLAIWE